MTKFDYELFHQLLKEIYRFQELFDEETNFEALDLDELNEALHTSFDKVDLRPCVKLPYFPLFENIKEWGENVDLWAYAELKEGERVIGAKGIIASSMDWIDPHTPVYLYEAAHIETGERVEEYVSEVYMDDIFVQVFSGLSTNDDPKGTDECRSLLERAIENTDMEETLDGRSRDELRYRCIVEGEGFEVWKVGFYQEGYQLLAISPKFLSGFRENALLASYVKGETVAEFKLPEMTDEQLKEVRLPGDGDACWYNIGGLDLDPERTTINKQRDLLNEQKVLASDVYRAVLEGRFNDVDQNGLPTVLPFYESMQIAHILVACRGVKGEETEAFGDAFMEACRKYCPGKLEQARDTINTVVKMIYK